MMSGNITHPIKKKKTMMMNNSYKEHTNKQIKTLCITNIISYVIILFHLIITLGILENLIALDLRLKELESFSKYDKPLTQKVYTNER
jgi:uncharacterized Tic20 family protein